jgi:anti-anti-sigma factor
MHTRTDAGSLVHESSFVRIFWRPGTLTVAPAGPQVGQREAPILTDEVTKQIVARGSATVASVPMRFLVVDLASVTFMSSMGLGAIIGFRNEAARVNAKAILLHANADLLGVLKMMRIDRLYTIAKDGAEVAKLTAG